MSLVYASSESSGGGGGGDGGGTWDDSEAPRAPDASHGPAGGGGGGFGFPHALVKDLFHVSLRKKQVTVAKPSDKSDSTTRRHVVIVKSQQTNVPVPPSTGVNSCPNASGSQPKSHVKPNKILPAKGVNKLPVKDQPRTNKSHLRTSNRFNSSSRLKRCSKHMKGDRSRLMNFVKKLIGTVRFGNDHFVAIMGYRDNVIGNSVISKVYYVEGLGHNLFSVGQFCDSDLEVAFRKHSCYV
nr:integrase, catalytic region, zinc finger, CCHC-type, peptidase aspartic, catalytic [Tanacetum cinerariifolium]